jgi:hypothetical protein
MDIAEFDDRLDALAASAIEQYKEEFAGKSKEKEVTNTQLAALVSASSGLGARGLGKLVAERRERNRRNEKALREDKGGKRPQNPSFWKVLHRVVDVDLEKLADEHGDRDAVFGAFAQRLAIELRFRRQLDNRMNQGRTR